MADCWLSLDGTTAASWLVDEPDQDMLEKVANGQGSDREWLVIQMGANLAPDGKKHCSDQEPRADKEFESDICISILLLEPQTRSSKILEKANQVASIQNSDSFIALTWSRLVIRCIR